MIDRFDNDMYIIIKIPKWFINSINCVKNTNHGITLILDRIHPPAIYTKLSSFNRLFDLKFPLLQSNTKRYSSNYENAQ